MSAATDTETKLSKRERRAIIAQRARAAMMRPPAPEAIEGWEAATNFKAAARMVNDGAQGRCSLESMRTAAQRLAQFYGLHADAFDPEPGTPT